MATDDVAGQGRVEEPLERGQKISVEAESSLREALTQYASSAPEQRAAVFEALKELLPSEIFVTGTVVSELEVPVCGVLDWPKNGHPLPSEALLFVLMETIKEAYSFKLLEAGKAFVWKGPSTAAVEEVVAKLARCLQVSEVDKDEPLRCVVRLGLALGEEQGRRACLSGPVAKSIDVQVRKCRQLLSLEEEEGLGELIMCMVSMMSTLQFDGPVAPLRREGERLYWPAEGRPASDGELVGVLVELLHSLYSMRRKRGRGDLPWRGPARLTKILSRSIQQRLTSDNLQRERTMLKRSALEVLFDVCVELGAEQGMRRLLTYEIIPIQRCFAWALARQDELPHYAKMLFQVGLLWWERLSLSHSSERRC